MAKASAVDTAPRTAPQPAAPQFSTAPRITNQIVINAFARAASALGYGEPWAFLARAGLNLAMLASDREGDYTGPALDTLPNLTAEERAALLAALAVLTDPQRPTPTPPSGGALRLNEALRAVPLEPAAARAIPDPGSGAAPGARMMAGIWNRYGGLLEKVAGVLRVDATLAAAVLAVESGGRAFGTSGRMIIRFELHIFHSLWGKQNPETFDRHFRFDAQSPWRGETHQWRPSEEEEWRGVHAGQEGEWTAFSFARVYCSDTAAKLSISMGAPQIMGFNHARLAYADVEAMYDAFENDERSQILGFFDFVRTDARLLDAMRSDELLTFATYYNGSAVAETYANLMRDALGTLRSLLPQPVLEPPAPEPTPPTAPPTAPPVTPPVTEPYDPLVPVGPHGSVPHTKPQPPLSPSVRPPSAPTTGAAPPIDLPVPPAQEAGLLRDVDPALYTYWREHVREGFEQNSEMFNRILDAFMEPYYTTVWMYRVLFSVGVLSFIAAVGLSIWTQSPWYGIIFGGLSAAAFISYFFNRPLQALEENLHFVTWLGIIYNTYWTRLAYMFDRSTVQTDLHTATNDAVQELDRLLDKHAHLSGKRPQARASRRHAARAGSGPGESGDTPDGSIDG